MFHNTPFLPYFQKCLLWLCLVWWIGRIYQKWKILTLVHVLALKSKSVLPQSASFSRAETHMWWSKFHFTWKKWYFSSLSNHFCNGYLHDKYVIIYLVLKVFVLFHNKFVVGTFSKRANYCLYFLKNYVQICTFFTLL